MSLSLYASSLSIVLLDFIHEASCLFPFLCVRKKKIPTCFKGYLDVNLLFLLGIFAVVK